MEQLRSSFFLESIGFFFLETLSIESKAIRVIITTENGYSLRDAGPRPRFDRKSERFSLSWQTSNEHYSSSSRRILTNKVSSFRLGKDLSIDIGTFRFKIRAKMTPQRRSKPIDDYPSKFDWPGIKELITSTFSHLPTPYLSVSKSLSPLPPPPPLTPSLSPSLSPSVVYITTLFFSFLAKFKV